jgi:hypothetical protein
LARDELDAELSAPEFDDEPGLDDEEQQLAAGLASLPKVPNTSAKFVVRIISFHCTYSSELV